MGLLVFLELCQLSGKCLFFKDLVAKPLLKLTVLLIDVKTLETFPLASKMNLSLLPLQFFVISNTIGHEKHLVNSCHLP